MIRPSITLVEVVTLLNELVALDQDAMTALVENRVVCNEALANHPTVQVVGLLGDGDNNCMVGILGILNGIFGTDDEHCGALEAVFDGDRLIGFGLRKGVLDGLVRHAW